MHRDTKRGRCLVFMYTRSAQLAAISALAGLGATAACGGSSEFSDDGEELGTVAAALVNESGNDPFLRSWAPVVAVTAQGTTITANTDEDPAICNGSNGFVVVQKDATSDKFLTTTWRLGAHKWSTAWTALGTKTFDSKPACASMDAVDGTDGEPPWKMAVVGKDKGTGKFYVTVAQTNTAGGNTPPPPPSGATAWAKISDDVYASGAGASVGQGRMVVVGRASNNRIYAHYRTLPYANGSWSAAIQANALPTGWTAVGSPTIAMTLLPVNQFTVVVLAKNAQNQYKLFFTYFDETAFTSGSWRDVWSPDITPQGDPALEFTHGDCIVGTNQCGDAENLTVYTRSGSSMYQSSGYDLGLGSYGFVGVHTGADAFVGGPAALGNAHNDGNHVVVARKSNGSLYYTEGGLPSVGTIYGY